MIPTGAGYERALRTALKINIYLDGWTKLWGPDRAQELFDQAPPARNNHPRRHPRRLPADTGQRAIPAIFPIRSRRDDMSEFTCAECGKALEGGAYIIISNDGSATICGDCNKQLTEWTVIAEAAIRRALGPEEAL